MSRRRARHCEPYRRCPVLVAAIDQGTTSTRCLVFDGTEAGRHDLEHEQILPRSRWVEHNPGLTNQR